MQVGTFFKNEQRIIEQDFAHYISSLCGVLVAKSIFVETSWF